MTEFSFSHLVGGSGSSTYSYDNTSQLTGADHSNQSDETYTYDASGNRTISGYTTGDNNQLTSNGTFDFTYDDEGNRLTMTRISSAQADDKTTEYTWDYRNRLTKVVEKNNSGTITQSIEYVYDIWDRRIEKSFDADGAGGGTAVVTRWAYDGDDIILTVDATGLVTHRYVHGPAVDQILADDATGAEKYFPLTDNLGSVRDIIDAEGNVENHIVYDAFGRVTSETTAAFNFHFGYTGRERDEETGLDYYRKRHYDAVHGRFISEDWLGILAGDPNFGRYVRNNPTNYTDPSGLLSLSIGDASPDDPGSWAQPPSFGGGSSGNSGGTVSRPAGGGAGNSGNGNGGSSSGGSGGGASASNDDPQATPAPWMAAGYLGNHMSEEELRAYMRQAHENIDTSWIALVPEMTAWAGVTGGDGSHRPAEFRGFWETLGSDLIAMATNPFQTQVAFGLGMLQGVANIVNYVHQAAAGLAALALYAHPGMGHLIATGVIDPDLFEVSDWANGLITHEDPTLHKVSKFLGGEGVLMVLTLGTSKVSWLARPATQGLGRLRPPTGGCFAAGEGVWMVRTGAFAEYAAADLEQTDAAADASWRWTALSVVALVGWQVAMRTRKRKVQQDARDALFESLGKEVGACRVELNQDLPGGPMCHAQAASDCNEEPPPCRCIRPQQVDAVRRTADHPAARRSSLRSLGARGRRYAGRALIACALVSAAILGWSGSEDESSPGRDGEAATNYAAAPQGQAMAASPSLYTKPIELIRVGERVG